MQSVHIVRKSDVKRTPRVVQLEGMFDLGKREEAAEEWFLKAEHENIEDWSIGAILGPSGSGKSTIMEELFGSPKTFKWNITNSLVDDFKKDLPMKSIIDSLSGVGFGSPPSWLKPFDVLSTGQKFRCELARAMTENEDSVIIIDEFTSVVDRTVAQIASAAFAKAIRLLESVLLSCLVIMTLSNGCNRTGHMKCLTVFLLGGVFSDDQTLNSKSLDQKFLDGKNIVNITI